MRVCMTNRRPLDPRYMLFCLGITGLGALQQTAHWHAWLTMAPAPAEF
jgi:hypothetical protein